MVHQVQSNPGLVGQILENKGYVLDVCCPATGDRLPSTLEPYAGVVVFGGPMSANDQDTLPFIKAELDWLPQVLASQTPFLGICLGAQLLARSLGGTVAPHVNRQVEIGYFPLEATPEGRSLLDPISHVYHWHREGFDLPTGAVLLATGETFPNQAFRYGPSAYGFQFHPEITADLIDQWTTKAADQLTQPGAQSQQCQFDQHRQHGTAVKDWLQRFLDQWLQTPAVVFPQR
ncbi:MAG: gamma-glutamyl-gamma-aminobutyrate hydrolase family protein [Synechococcales bacterium]|nr:gamma-glutamyl-gamma-aminobutyrate hydrolase family protein [Synechococcales bacterium]